MAQILVVDDSTTMRQMVAFTLTSAGHEVVEAPDGNQALATAKTKKFDLVITDVNMPGMNGIDLVQSLRALPDCKFIPILVLTTEAGAELKQKGKSAGATGWIVKPFNPEVLLETLKKVL
ncbi:MAG TPA: response regulator [Burkholderiales bacterium]|jgi:two-component system chemotaxis response regulator CheY|nr:response regulator [Burkholderiales bacterium]